MNHETFSVLHIIMLHMINKVRDFPDSLMVKIPSFHFRGTGLVPGWGAKIPMAWPKH